jgi:hypothetical protein
VQGHPVHASHLIKTSRTSPFKIIPECQQVRAVSQFSVMFSSVTREKMNEKENAVTEQWCYGEIISGQRTDIKALSGY